MKIAAAAALHLRSDAIVISMQLLSAFTEAYAKGACVCVPLPLVQVVSGSITGGYVYRGSKYADLFGGENGKSCRQPVVSARQQIIRTTVQLLLIPFSFDDHQLYTCNLQWRECHALQKNCWQCATTAQCLQHVLRARLCALLRLQAITYLLTTRPGTEQCTCSLRVLLLLLLLSLQLQLVARSLPRASALHVDAPATPAQSLDSLRCLAADFNNVDLQSVVTALQSDHWTWEIFAEFLLVCAHWLAAATRTTSS